MVVVGRNNFADICRKGEARNKVKTPSISIVFTKDSGVGDQLNQVGLIPQSRGLPLLEGEAWFLSIINLEASRGSERMGTRTKRRACFYSTANCSYRKPGL